jgi:DNA repair protein SbcC/Rad50
VRLVELSLRNYRVFEEVDLELPARVIGIFGHNGAGKSTLVESVLFALYGVDGARTKKDGIRTHGLLTDCSVRLVFEHGGQQYEVRRTIAGRNHKPDAQLYVGGTLLATGVQEVDAAIQSVLHMDLRVFRASVFAEQKQLDAFSDVGPAKRKEMALRLLGIKPVDEARSAAKREARTAKQSAQELAGSLPDLAAIEAELKEARDIARQRATEAKEATAITKEADRLAKASRKAFDEADGVRQRVDHITVEIRTRTEQRELLQGRHDELTARLEDIDDEMEDLPEREKDLAVVEGLGDKLVAARAVVAEQRKLEKARADLDGILAPDTDASLQRLEATAADLEEARTALARCRAESEHAASALSVSEDRLARAGEADPAQPCPTCGRELGDDFPAYVRHCRDEHRAAVKRAADTGKQLAAAERSAKTTEDAHRKAVRTNDDARNAAERRAAAQQRVDELLVTVTDLQLSLGEDEPDVGALEAAVGGLRDLREQVSELRAHAKQRAQTEKDAVAAAAQLASVAATLEKLVAEAEDLAFDPARHAEVRDVLRDAEEALEAARTAEREALADLADAEKVFARLTGQLEQAKETEARASELREETRLLDKVAVLLDGFRDHLVARVGPELSREAEGLFRELTNREYDDLKIDDDDLSIRIADGDQYFGIERFSGSETDLANLALRVAISTHLSRVSGADIGMMVLDEVLGSLDQERKDLMVQAMGRLSERFHQLFVITHAEQVKDQFPASILVTKVGRRRSIAVPV